MGKPTGFMEYERELPAGPLALRAGERLERVSRAFLDKTKLRDQGARCWIAVSHFAIPAS